MFYNKKLSSFFMCGTSQHEHHSSMHNALGQVQKVIIHNYTSHRHENENKLSDNCINRPNMD